MTNNSQTREPNFIVFGGAFDPPHCGHRDCVEFAKQRFPDAEICIIPSLLAPLTKSATKLSSASFEDRMEMCRIAFGKLKSPPRVMDIEKYLATPSYTVQTLTQLKKEFPEKRFGLLIGLDQLAKFHLWLKPLQILEIASLIVIPRDDISMKQTITDFSENLGISIEGTHDSRIDLGHYLPLFFISKTTLPISSSRIRQMSEEGESPKTFIDPKVMNYIQTKKLYSSKAR